MVLKHETRDQGSPKGRPKVWFCAHPEDHEGFFAQIKDELLLYQNCAVYYDEEPTAPYEEAKLLEDLSEMKLFVMPVTTKLLTTPSRAMDVELAFAQKAHIPVLPLMQESGLAELFNRKCGNLQYLERNDGDTTAIRYEEKLEKYLSAVLLGDELADKIRKAFDAYIFLSYRKKDRAYARELMRLIHANEFCQDIAIWYDEYLVPGENFNDSIETALKECELFALAVTPNLLEDGNYVMNVEYKRARESQKPIFPAEIAPTDRAALEEKFSDIPPCTDAHDSGALSKSLRDALSKIAFRENDKDARHNFFIGLAYLSGIDVEVDHTRALSLIRSAADGGLPEAMKKLMQMYRDGEGVERDHGEAIDWQKKYTEHLKSACLEGKGDVGAYLDELMVLADYCAETGRTDEARAAYFSLIRSAEKHAAESHFFREMALRGYDCLGDSFMDADVPEKAYPCYNKCAELARDWPMEYSDGELCYYTVLAYNKIGDAYLAKGYLGLAEDNYSTAWTTALGTVGDPPDPRGLRCAIQGNRKMGRVHVAFGEPDEASFYLDEALDFAKQLYELDPSGESQREMAESAIDLGEAALADRNTKDAKAHFEEAYRYATAFYREKSTFSSRRLLAVCEEKLGDFGLAENNESEAFAHYDAALDGFRGLAEETGTAQVRRDLLRCLLRQASVAQALGRSAVAEKYLEEARRIAAALREEKDSLSARQDLALCEESLGDFYRKTGELLYAEEHYRAAILLRRRIKRSSEMPEHAHQLAKAFGGLAETCRGPRRSYWLHRARALEKKITWRCPNVAEYREQLAILDGKLHISSKLNPKNVSTVAAGNLLWFASELWYNYFNLPADFIYWLMGAPGMILTLFGLHRIFEPAILAKYQKKMRKKRREDRMSYLSAVCDELASLLLWACLFAVLRVLLLEWIS